MNTPATDTPAATAAPKQRVTIGDKTGTVFVDGEPTGIEITVHNEHGMTRAELVRRLNLEVTEADVMAWIDAEAIRVRGIVGDEHSMTLTMRVSHYVTGFQAHYEASLNSSAFDRVHSGRTIADALASSRSETPAMIAERKRKEAAELLAEAERFEQRAQSEVRG